MNRTFLAGIAVLLMLLVPVTIFAQVTQVPNGMNFQGRLTRPDGTPVPDGNYSLRFSLWDAASGGTERWNQTIASVPVRNGIIAVLIGLFAPSDFNGNR